MSNPVSPSLKNLPKVAVDLKSELEGFDPSCMKKAATTEKNVLPSAEGMSKSFITNLKHRKIWIFEIISRELES